MLDEKTGGLWNGTIQVLTSNNGHLERAVATLRAFGIPEDAIVPLSQESILRHFNYDAGFIERMEEIHKKNETLRGHGKWLVGVERYPDYTLPQLANIENDDRLVQVIGGLDRQYKKNGVNMFDKHPELTEYATMDADKLRELLREIKRDTELVGWEQHVDTEAMRNQITAFDTSTTEWLKGQF